jgi:GAF domain-containing protein
MLVAGVKDPEQLALLREIGMRSAMLVPMRLGERTIGSMTFVTAESARTFTPEDLAFAEDLAHRAAVAVENARLYAAARRGA